MPLAGLVQSQEVCFLVEIDMKFVQVMKSVAFAAAFVASAPSMAAGCGGAGCTFSSGTSALTFSADELGVLGVISGFPNAGTGGTVQSGTSLASDGVTIVPLANPLSYDSVNTQIIDANGNAVQTVTDQLNATSAVLTAAGDAVASGSAIGQTVLLQRGTHTVTLSNFQVNSSNSSLTVDMLVNGTLHPSVLLALGDPTTPIAISTTKSADGKYHAVGAVNNLILQGTYTKGQPASTATGALGLFTAGLGVTASSAIMAALNSNMGNLAMDVAFTSAVPEPSTLGMAALGLGVAGFVARRRSKV